jgi:hypothetical protein
MLRKEFPSKEKLGFQELELNDMKEGGRGLALQPTSRISVLVEV